MRWILDNAFALSASFHDGARLVSYPWGSWHNDTGYKYTDKEAYMTPGKVNYGWGPINVIVSAMACVGIYSQNQTRNGIAPLLECHFLSKLYPTSQPA